MLKGRKAEVLRSKFSSANGGASERFEELVVIDEKIRFSDEGNEDDSNVVKIVRRNLQGKEYLHVEPVKKGEGIGPMFGGNYLNCTGSMYGNIKYPLPIHDRYESPQQYASNSI